MTFILCVFAVNGHAQTLKPIFVDLELILAVDCSSSVEPDESKRYKNAFAMAGAMGLTKAKLFSSAKHYVKVLDKEEKKFSEAFNAQKSKQVSDREVQGELLEKSIANHAQCFAKPSKRLMLDLMSSFLNYLAVGRLNCS